MQKLFVKFPILTYVGLLNSILVFYFSQTDSIKPLRLVKILPYIVPDATKNNVFIGNCVMRQLTFI